jgi:hypothetical protein
VAEAVDEHVLTLDGPMRYPGGKDEMYHVVCSCGRYMSPPGTNPDSRRMWVAARTHKVSKEAQ